MFKLNIIRAIREKAFVQFVFSYKKTKPSQTYSQT